MTHRELNLRRLMSAIEMIESVTEQTGYTKDALVLLRHHERLLLQAISKEYHGYSRQSDLHPRRLEAS